MRAAPAQIIVGRPAGLHLSSKWTSVHADKCGTTSRSYAALQFCRWRFAGRRESPRTTAKQQAEWKINDTQSKPIGAPDWFGQRNNRRFVSNDTVFAQAMCVRAAAPTVISPAAKMEINGYAILAVAMPDANRPVDQISFNLSYDSQDGEGDSIPADPPVVLNHTNAARTSWPPPATARN